MKISRKLTVIKEIKNDRSESLVRTLTGCSFTRKNVKRAVLDSGFSAMGITADSLAERLAEVI